MPRARHLSTSVLLAMAPKVWMHKPFLNNPSRAWESEKKIEVRRSFGAGVVVEVISEAYFY